MVQIHFCYVSSHELVYYTDRHLYFVAGCIQLYVPIFLTHSHRSCTNQIVFLTMYTCKHRDINIPIISDYLCQLPLRRVNVSWRLSVWLLAK